MPIERKEAVEFVRNKLGIEDVPDPTQLDLQFLNKISRGLLSEVPFQNVTLYKTAPERRFPSEDDVIRFGLSLQGGVCIHINWFASLLLRALGFDLFTIAGMYAASWNSMDDHLMPIVRGLQDPEDPDCKETMFLVDVGTGYPTPSAVPLHRLPHEFPAIAGYELRFDKVGDKYYRMHRHGDSTNDPDCPRLHDGWRGKISFSLNPRDPASLRCSMQNIFVIDPPSDFMSLMRIFRWPKDEGGQVIGFRGQELLIFSDDREKNKPQKQKIKIDFEDLEETVSKYFPTIHSSDLKEAIPLITNIMKLQSVLTV